MKRIHIRRGGETLGPFRADDVSRLLNTGQVEREDLAWTEGLVDWEPLGRVLPLALAGEESTFPGVRSRRDPSSGETKERRWFLFELPFALLYPLRGSGCFLLGGLALALLFGGFLLTIPFAFRSPYLWGLVLLIGLTSICYYAACVQQVIRATASGDDNMAEGPEISNLHDEMSRAVLQIIGTTAGCLAPAALAWELGRRGLVETAWLVPALGAAGLVCLPMALLATTVLGAVSAGLRPGVVFPAMLRSLPRYLLILAFMALSLTGAAMLALELMQRLITPAAAAVMVPLILYLGLVLARLTGLIYKTSPSRLGWFG